MIWTEWKAKTGEEAVTAAILLDEYKDAGYWARHYSTVRLSLGTFFLTAASGIVYHQWDKPNCFVALVAAGIALLGFTLFSIFSYYTFRKMNDQLTVVNEYRRVLGRDEEKKKPILLYHWWLSPTGLPLGGIVLLLFLGFVCAWSKSHFTPKMSKGEGKTKLPISVQVGQSDPVTLDVPLKVSATKE